MPDVEPRRAPETPPSASRRDTAARPGGSLIDPPTLMRIKSLQMRARAVVEGFFKGLHRSPYHGFSVEFSEYREYSPGDDPRYLDWRLFARSDRYYVKRFEDETNLRCYLVLDTSRSMGYSSGSYSKGEYARTAAATVAYFLSSQRDAVGLITFEDRVTEYLPPRHRPGHLRRLMAMLEREPAGKATDLTRPLEEIAATVRKRGLIVLISDLLAPIDALKTRLGYLRSRGHEVILLRVLDPAETAFGFETPAMFRDAESGRELYIDPGAARAEYLRRFSAHAAGVERSCVDLGVEYESVTTDQPLELVLFDLLKARERRSRVGPPRSPGARGPPLSFLTPLYALGLLAVAAPIVFHLIRRSPRGEVAFSSLMFLAPTPPKVTRRSRIEHWLLLLLRAAALSLLALAFARPFLRQAEGQDPGGTEQRRVAVLVDTSASMRRADLWSRAKAQAAAVIAGCRPTDQLAVFAFDAASKPMLGFEESATLDPSRRAAVASARLAGLSPSWSATNLGQALVDAVSAVQDAGESGGKAPRMPRRVVLISDLQQGSKLEALGDFEWPSDVVLELKTVADDRGNAGPQWLADPGDPEAAGAVPSRRVRVTNDPGAAREAFVLGWVDEAGAAVGEPVDVYVPPGQSRVVKVPLPPLKPNAPPPSLRLKGDAHTFDNTLFSADGRKEDATVLFVGKDAAEDLAGLLYFLGRVFLDTPRRTVRVVPAAPGSALLWDTERSTPLVVVSGETTAGNAERLRTFAGGGGTVLYVVDGPGRAATLAALAGVAPFEVEEAAVKRDVMFGEIAFDHPLFAPLAGPQFNDFTKIRFWKYQRAKPDALGDARVVARFEGGDAALVEKPVGKGRLVVMFSGWTPADGQLARSSKFVPLMAAMLESRGPRPFEAAEYAVGDRVPLPVQEEKANGPVVHKPDGTAVEVASGEAAFSGTDQPGVYTVETSLGPRSFAVNLDPAEGKTNPLGAETLEQLGCRLTNPEREAAELETLRQLKSAELESRQKYWRTLILAAIGVLTVETWLAGRAVQPRPARAEALAT